MAQISMRYILIRKSNINEEISLPDILTRFLNENYDVDQKESTINFKNGKVNYLFKQGDSAERCFFTLSSKSNIRSAAQCIESICENIRKSGMLQDFYFLKVYDGLSAYYCEKLYPKYAIYERKLRYMILLIVTKSYGGAWIENTLNDDYKDSISQKARKSISQIDMEDILEYFDLSELENYLFEPRKIDMDKFVNDELTPEKLEMLGKQEICSLIEQVRNPSSLWERVFNDLGSVDEWKREIKNVHNVRNSVAHHKKVTTEQYYKTLKQLKNINHKLDAAIDTAVSRENEEAKMIDILASFAVLTGKLLSSQFNANSIGNMLIAFSKRMKELVKPIETHFQPDIVEVIKENALEYSTLDMVSDYKEAVQNFVSSLNRYDALTDIDNSIKESMKEFNKIGETWEQYQVAAIGTVAKFENLAKQISSVQLHDDKSL